MANIDLVIKIPEEKLSIIKNKMYCGIYDPDLYKAIENGIVIPKGHGKIVDANHVLENGDNWEVETALMQTEAIIEADTTYNPCDTNPFGDDRFGG